MYFHQSPEIQQNWDLQHHSENNTNHFHNDSNNNEDENEDNMTSTYENAIMCVKNEEADKIIESIIKLAEEKGEKEWLIQKLPASAIFATYKKK